MKLLASLAVVLVAAAGCEKKESKLDSVAKPMPPGAAAPKGDLEARVAKLEQYGEALDFLQKVYDQQKAQQEEQANREPAPDAVFAVDITQNLAFNHYEGPATGAAVTIVEAWDFA